MAWDEAAFGAGAPSKQRQTKAQECQMEIGLHSPRRIRCVIKAGWGDISRDIYTPKGPQKSLYQHTVKIKRSSYC